MKTQAVLALRRSRWWCSPCRSSTPTFVVAQADEVRPPGLPRRRQPLPPPLQPHRLQPAPDRALPVRVDAAARRRSRSRCASSRTPTTTATSTTGWTRGHGRARRWSSLAASVYLVYVLEILKFRRLDAIRVRRARPEASQEEVERDVARDFETGEFEAVACETGEFPRIQP